LGSARMRNVLPKWRRNLQSGKITRATNIELDWVNYYYYFKSLEGFNKLVLLPFACYWFALIFLKSTFAMFESIPELANVDITIGSHWNAVALSQILLPLAGVLASDLAHFHPLPLPHIIVPLAIIHVLVALLSQLTFSLAPIPIVRSRVCWVCLLVIVLALAMSLAIKNAASIVVTVLEVYLRIQVCLVRMVKCVNMERVLVEPLGEVWSLGEAEQELFGELTLS
jgi:hypothetical protein